MHIKGIILIIGICFSISEAASQHLSHEVLVPAAGVAAKDGVYYSQTIGETAVELIGDNDYILTQGFQQPRLKIKTGTQPPGTGVNVYPNPAINNVNIELFGGSARSFLITIVNMSGTVVFSDEMNFTQAYWEVREIPLIGFSRGLYFVRVVSTDKMIIRTFKLEKM